MMRNLIKYTIIFIASTALLAHKLAAIENTRAQFVCAKTCTCASEYLSDVPIMKWLTLPTNNKTRQDNNVETEDQDIILAQNPLIFAAYCLQDDNLLSVRSEEFTPTVEALTILYGPDSVNKTVEHELNGFSKLIALDIKGYEPRLSLTHKHSEVQLHHNALLELRNLRYLNVQNIRIVPFSNAPRLHYESYSLNQSNIHNDFNLTFLESEDEDIIPYAEYREQRSSLSMFSHLADLNFLRLFNCRIDTIAQEMFDGLQNLHSLSLQNNDIVELPENTFARTSLLQSLTLSKNQIKFIHSESLSGLVHLENLDLSGNQLKTLSNATFASLPKLNSLNLLDNPLKYLASYTFERTNTIRNLWIGSTRGLVVQEDTFATLNQLENLVLFGLNVSVLHKGILRGLTNLKRLRVSGNIESVVFDTFTESSLLEELILRQSSLKAISVDAFYGLERLKRLDLSHNKLEILQPGIFDQLNSLKELILTYNNFVTLPRMVLANLQHVDMIRLEANPWNCSCDLTEWRSLKLNTKKVIRTIKRPCTYQYDKIPCASIQTEVYIHDSRSTPKCETPEVYKGWSVLHAVSTNEECADEKEMFAKKYLKNKFKRKRTLENAHKDNSGITIDVSVDDHIDRNNEDNSLANLSPYLDINDALF